MYKKNLQQVVLSIILMVSTIATNADSFYGSHKPFLFNEDYSGFKRYTLITGPMVYQDQASDKFTEGFRAAKFEVIDGIYTQQVYDYDNSSSAISLFKQVKESLLSEGFELSFECEGKKCGPVEGWQLLFSENIAGKDDAQFYVVGRLGNSQSSIAAKAVYITEFDSQPRLIIDSIQKTKSPMGSAIKTNGFGGIYSTWRKTNSLQPIGSVFFSTNSKQLGDSSQLNHLIDDMKAHPKSKYLLVGFSDPRGNSVANKSLSLERASSLKNTLSSQFSEINDNLIVYGAGELNEPSSNLANARRVSVFRFQE